MPRSGAARTPALGGVPVTVKVNIDQQGFATTNGLKLQRDVIAKTNSPVIDNLRKAGAVILGRTNCPAFSYRWFTTNLDPWRHQKSARSRHHAGRLVRRRGGGGRGRHRPYRARHRHRRIDPLSGLCLRRPWPAADRRAVSRRSTRRCPSARSGRRSPRSPARWRAPSAISGSRWRRCRASTCAIPGGCRRRWKARRCRSAPRCASIPTASIPCRGQGRRCRCRQAAGAGRLDRRGNRHHAAAARGGGICRPNSGSATAMKRSWRPPSAKAIPARWPACAATAPRCLPFDAAAFSKALTRRATLTREWLEFFEKYAVLLMPVSGELPFPDHLDRKDEASFARVWHAQMPQIAIPFMGLPGLTVSTGLVGRDSRRRAGRLRPLPRGSLPCRGRGDRGRRNAVGGDRSAS